MKKLCAAFAAVSPHLVKETEIGTMYVKNLRPKEMTLTPHGREISESNQSRTIFYDLEAFKDMTVTKYTI